MRSLRRILILLPLIGACAFLPACVKQSPTRQITAERKPVEGPGSRINLNTAKANELETLPGIGQALAERIVAHREKHGPFRRPEHLIIVRGISDQKFRALQGLVTVE